jgi:hypothetical protein
MLVINQYIELKITTSVKEYVSYVSETGYRKYYFVNRTIKNRNQVTA